MIFLAIQPCFYIQRISQSTTSRWIVLLCNDIAQAQSRMVDFKTIMTWDLLQTKKIKSKLSNTWLTPYWITISMYNWSMVNLPNAWVCWETLCVDDQQSSRFPPLSQVSQLTDDGLTLSSRRFCSSVNCFCFLWITCKLKNKQSTTHLSQQLFISLTYE